MRDFSEAPDKQKHTITQKQRHQINLALEKVLIQHKDGSVDYAVGHSDASIAERLGITVPHVRYQRQQVFGKLKSRMDPQKPAVGSFDEVYTRLADIEFFLENNFGWKKNHD